MQIHWRQALSPGQKKTRATYAHGWQVTSGIYKLLLDDEVDTLTFYMYSNLSLEIYLSLSEGLEYQEIR